MTRNPLPFRRATETFEFCHSDLNYWVSVGYHPNGRVGEVFVQAEKTSSQVEWLARDAAILISLALQFDCPLETMRHTITREETGAPSTLSGAILDFLADELATIEGRAA